MRRRGVPWRPTKAELLAAEGRRVPDIVAPGLRVLFCGINPGLYSGATGHHFARPGNRFWKALHLAGFTPRELSPFEEDALLAYGLGVTNFVNRATATADRLHADELRRGARRLARKVRRYRPKLVGVVGIDAYRVAFRRRHAKVGPQPETIDDTRLWLLPNTSGLQASYQLAALVAQFRALREAALEAQARGYTPPDRAHEKEAAGPGKALPPGRSSGQGEGMAADVHAERKAREFDFDPFTRLHPEVRKRLVALAREVHVPAGERLIWEKSAASGCYVLAQGALRVVGSPADRTLASLLPPALVGEVGPVRGSPRTASVVAVAPSTVLFISITDLREAMADDPGFASALKEHVERVMRGAR